MVVLLSLSLSLSLAALWQHFPFQRDIFGEKEKKERKKKHKRALHTRVFFIPQIKFLAMFLNADR
jgi:hypothetical protein